MGGPKVLWCNFYATQTTRQGLTLRWLEKMLKVYPVKWPVIIHDRFRCIFVMDWGETDLYVSCRHVCSVFLILNLKKKISANLQKGIKTTPVLQWHGLHILVYDSQVRINKRVGRKVWKDKNIFCLSLIAFWSLTLIFTLIYVELNSVSFLI